MTINLSELEDLFAEIKYIIDDFENNNYQDRRIKLFLANGDKLDYRVTKDSIAHLLGININYLYSTNQFKSKHAFDLLKEVISNPYKIHNLEKDKIINYNVLFSQYTKRKIKYFKDNINISIQDTEMVCKYNSSRSYIAGENNEKYDYIIVKKYKDKTIGVTCLVKHGHEDYYIPMSSQIYDDEDIFNQDFASILINQEVTLLNVINLSNAFETYNKSYKLFMENKVKKTKKLRDYKEQLGFIIDVSQDYEFTNDKAIGKVEDCQFDNKLINIIVESIRNGKIINDNFDSNLSMIIDAFNDFLVNNVSSLDSVGKSYTNLKNELETVKRDLLASKKINESLTKQNKNLNNQVDDITKENIELKSIKQKVYEMVKPSN